MLSEAKNKILTQVSAGTPMGDYLRRFWHPVAGAAEFDEKSVRAIRLMGEDLTLFKDMSGTYGLVDRHCPHRRADLSYGFVEEVGIRCNYHGWRMDETGACVEQPFEDTVNPNNKSKDRCAITAYPVREVAGLLFAYMGPLPAPVLPKYDIFMRRDGRFKITQYPRLDCNWFVSAENSVDSTHLQLLHQEPPEAKFKPLDSTRGYIDDVLASDYYATDYGIMKKRTYHGGTTDEHPMIFPLWLRTRSAIWMRTPIDDEHTNHWTFDFKQGAPTDEIQVEYLAPFKDPPDAIHPVAKFDNLPRHGWPLSEDVVMWETQGVIADRTQEHLGASDKGVALLRKMMFEEIERVQRGEDPLGVFRDERIIDTNLEKSINMTYPTGHVAKTIPVKEPV